MHKQYDILVSHCNPDTARLGSQFSITKLVVSILGEAVLYFRLHSARHSQLISSPFRSMKTHIMSGRVRRSQCETRCRAVCSSCLSFRSALPQYTPRFGGNTGLVLLRGEAGATHLPHVSGRAECPDQLFTQKPHYGRAYLTLVTSDSCRSGCQTASL
jgi:hypothetical protein